jgi:radical SAM protein with 4Fe4S-binding SPASM domain
MELSTDEACYMVEELARAGVVDLAISGGEPLLRRDLFAIVRHARDQGLSVGVGTNGALVTKRRAGQLAETGIGRLQVSMDGLRESHDWLRAWPGLFDRAVRAIQVARDAGLRVHVCCTVNRANWQELGELTNFVEGLGVRRINFSRYVPTGRPTAGLDLESYEWRTVVDNCVRLRDSHNESMEVVSHLAQQILVEPDLNLIPGFAGCQAGCGQGCISANGTVFPCVLLPIPMGNIRIRPFREIWQTSPVVSALRSRERFGGRCGNCEVRNQCGGCRAVAYAATGDYLAGDPRCWLDWKEKAVTFYNHLEEVNHGIN